MRLVDGKPPHSNSSVVSLNAVTILREIGSALTRRTLPLDGGGLGGGGAATV